MILGVFDRDISARTALEVPMCYISGRLNMDLNPREMGLWVFGALCMGAIVFALPIIVLDGELGMPSSWAMDGQMDGLVVMGTIVYTSLIWSMNLKLSFVSHQWSLQSCVAVMILSMAFYYGSMSWYNSKTFYDLRFYEFLDAFNVHMKRPITWFIMLLVLGTVAIVELALNHCRSLRKDGRDMLLWRGIRRESWALNPPFPKLKRCPVRVFA